MVGDTVATPDANSNDIISAADLVGCACCERRTAPLEADPLWRKGADHALLMIAAVGAVALAVIPARASIYEVDSRTGFATPFGFDFSAFGPPGNSVSTQDTRTVNGVTITTRTSGGTFNVAREGTNYTGNFAVGDTLLTQAGLSDDFILSFSGVPVYGVGMQFEPFSAYLGSYTAILEVFDTAGHKIADFTRSGSKTTTEDGSVPFLGALSTDVAIGTIQLSVGTLRAPFFSSWGCRSQRNDVVDGASGGA